MNAEVYSSPPELEDQGPGPRLMTARTLTGDAVINRQGDTLGKITEIMLDVPGGRIAYAVMSSGGFLGMGDRLFALPWSALTLDTVQKCFVIDADAARFEDAPGFDKDRWPSSADAAVNDRRWSDAPGVREEDRVIHSYWGSRPYWD